MGKSRKDNKDKFDKKKTRLQDKTLNSKNNKYKKIYIQQTDKETEETDEQQ